MKCSKEIAEKVKRYQKLKSEEEKLYKEIEKYFVEELDAEGFQEPFIADKPKGEKQNGDEYCDQYCVYEDWYEGTYYHQIEGSRKYVGYSFSV
ncbi:MAG: hypothetical protein IKT67_12920 [Lachnospiraceae bacterium]|nr:hypothetical protein [Lachnospiraceae bacterium]